MKRQLLSIVFVLLVLHLHAQSYQIGHTTITLTDPSRNNRSIPTEIYYPADAAGTNVPVAAANSEAFPVLSFGHGFVMTWDAYQNIWEAVVPEGFIIAFPKTEGSFAPSHGEFGKDLAFVLSALAALGQDNTSLFYQRIDPVQNCVMGHSMGGGAAFLAAQHSPSVKTLAALAPAETTPSAIQAATGLSAPALIFSGGNDCVTPPPNHQIPMYNAFAGSCKTYINIVGGSHCQMASANLLCNFGEATCTPAPEISRPEQHQMINRYLLPWLKFELKGDCTAGALFDSLITAGTGITFQKTCSLCSATAATEPANHFSINIYPDPFSDVLNMQWIRPETTTVAIRLYALDGRIICTQTLSQVSAGETTQLDIPARTLPGVYFLQVVAAGEQYGKMVVRE